MLEPDERTNEERDADDKAFWATLNAQRHAKIIEAAADLKLTINWPQGTFPNDEQGAFLDASGFAVGHFDDDATALAFLDGWGAALYLHPVILAGKEPTP